MKVIKANPVWIPTDVAITRKLGFPEIIMPGNKNLITILRNITLRARSFFP